MAEVRFEHVYKSFDQVEIVHDVSMQIKDQEFLVPGASRKENRNLWHNNVATSTRYARSRRAPMDVRTV